MRGRAPDASPVGSWPCDIVFRPFRERFVNLRSKDRGARDAMPARPRAVRLGLPACASRTSASSSSLVACASRAGGTSSITCGRSCTRLLRFPERLDFDPYVSFPFGARPVWPPFLDWLLAGLARLFVPGAMRRPSSTGSSGSRRCSARPRWWRSARSAGGSFSLLAGCVAGSAAGADAGASRALAARPGRPPGGGRTGRDALCSRAPWPCCRPRPPARQLRTAVVRAPSAPCACWSRRGRCPQILPVQGVIVVWALAAADRSAALERARSGAASPRVGCAAAAAGVPRQRRVRGDSASTRRWCSRTSSRSGSAAGALGLAGRWRSSGSESRAFATRRARIASALALGLVWRAGALVADSGAAADPAASGGLVHPRRGLSHHRGRGAAAALPGRLASTRAPRWLRSRSPSSCSRWHGCGSPGARGFGSVRRPATRAAVGLGRGLLRAGAGAGALRQRLRAGARA